MKLHLPVRLYHAVVTCGVWCTLHLGVTHATIYSGYYNYREYGQYSQIAGNAYGGVKEGGVDATSMSNYASLIFRENMVACRNLSGLSGQGLSG